ncbi:MAG TPA: hypothetical protein VKU41_27945 [Polyangiaceae bacterium]|nr:hypothetical protein [Polyangiaceae bacterium]
MSDPAPPHSSFTQALLPITAAALSAVMVAQVIGHDRRLVAPLVAFLVLLFAPAFFGRRRMRRLLISGDVERVIGTWEGSIQRVPHRDTMAPLLQATAYASYGRVDAARQALARAVRGPAWDAALEQRLFVETLLDTFEGDRDRAVRKAQALEALPMPRGGLLARRRITRLRKGLAALARAYAHVSREGDAKVLRRAAGASPLVHWAMRYASAILAVDSGQGGEVSELLSGAPDWPAESAFHEYHHELLARAAV